MMVRIGKPLTGIQLTQYIKQSTWSIKPLITPGSKNEVPEEVIKKVVQLSGLSSDNNQVIDLFKDSLNIQLAFINSLYEGENNIIRDKTNNHLFRLIKSDHDESNMLTLTDIQQQIELLDTQVSEEKGEVGFSKNDFFTIKS